MWCETQKQFAAALRNPGAPVPDAISKTNGKPSQKRFDVYRNNVAVSLSDAIADAYPVVQALVGEEFFKGVARIYTRLFLPTNPVLLDYGEDFPDFIATQSSTEALPYLGDVARLEWAWGRAYHAADATPIRIEDLAAVPAATTDEICLQFHPSVQLLHSRWPIVSIWQAHQGQGSLAALPDHGEQAVIMRRDLDVYVHAPEPMIYTFIEALYSGQTIAQASTVDTDATPQDLSAAIATLFETGAIVRLSQSS